MDPQNPPTRFSRLTSFASTSYLECPRLCWLTVFLVAADVSLITFHNIETAGILLFLIVCFSPLLARVTNALAIRGSGGASEDDIRALPGYIFRSSLGRNGSEMAGELVLSSEDSECCICLDRYEDGVRLCALPCDHHFHLRCIGDWLRINAICPLCKCSILQPEMLV